MKAIRSFIFITFLVALTGCNMQEPSTNSNNADYFNESVTPMEALTDTDYFREGALKHILLGELNRKNQAVGFHYENMPNTKGEVIEGTESSKDNQGVYEAKVTVEGIEKKSNHGKSSFFPEGWDSQEVVAAVNEAYENKVHINGNTYEGLTEEGIRVRMYLDNHEKIISAFPQFEGG